MFRKLVRVHILKFVLKSLPQKIFLSIEFVFFCHFIWTFLFTDKSSKPEKRSDKQTLVKELKELLSSCENQRLPVATVLARYYQHFGRLLKIGDYGALRLEDLVESSPSLQVSVCTYLFTVGVKLSALSYIDLLHGFS